MVFDFGAVELRNSAEFSVERLLDPFTTDQASAKPKRVVSAKYPHHVWHVDLSAVPTALGFWIPWFPKAMGQVWPFCFWIAVIVDHFSRKAVLVRSFRRPPTSEQVTRTLDIAISMVGRAPKYIVTDKGPQFREGYRDWCATRTIKHDSER